MANSLDRQITGDGYRNLVVKVTGVIDTANVVNQPVITLLDCKTNDQNLFLTGFRVDLIEWSISNPLEILLAEWILQRTISENKCSTIQFSTIYVLKFTISNIYIYASWPISTFSNGNQVNISEYFAYGTWVNVIILRNKTKTFRFFVIAAYRVYMFWLNNNQAFMLRARHV